MMVMNGSKPSNDSDDELSQFINWIAKTIHTQIRTHCYVRSSTISIPVEFLKSQTNNDDGMNYYLVVSDNEEVGDHTEDGQEQEQETVITQPVDQQPNSSQCTLRSETRVNYRLMNDPYSRESRATLAGSGGSGMDEDRALAQLYITEEDIDDDFRLEDIPARDLLSCLENCIFVNMFMEEMTSHHIPDQQTRRRS